MMKKYKKYFFAIYITTLLILKQFLVWCIPIFAISNGLQDDLLMVNMETSLLTMKYLGDYSQYTLVKGISFPAFLAFTEAVGISYTAALTILYSIACLIFIIAMNKLLKNKKLLYFIFPFLLFNPVTFSLDTFQRIYRNCLTPSQVLLIIGCAIIIYLNLKKDKKILGWSIFYGLSLAFFYHTREDSIWIMPLVICLTLILLVIIYINNKKYIFNLKKYLVVLLPIIILCSSTITISYINYKKYGIFTTNEINNSNFTLALKTIYSIKETENIQYVSVSRDKLNRLYKVSPTLNSIRGFLDNYMNIWTKEDRNKDDLEVENGWFLWALRDAVSEAGYYENANVANEFYLKINNEINEAIKTGKLETVTSMPSALMTPWRKEYASQLLKESFNILKYVVSYEDIETKILISTGSEESIALFEIASNNKALYPNTNIDIKGLYKSDDSEYDMSIVDGDNKLYTYSCKFDCNFEFNIPDDSVAGYYLLSTANDQNDKILLNGKIFKEGNFILSDYSAYNTQNYYIKVISYYTARLNFISKIYKTIGPYIFIISFISYIYLIIFKMKEYFDNILISTGIIGSFLVLTAGVGYNHITSCNSINTLYLSGGYSLILAFECITILSIVKIIFENKSKSIH